MSIHRGKFKVFVSEGPSPSPNAGASLSLTGRLGASWSPCGFFLLLLKDSGLRTCCLFLSVGFPGLSHQPPTSLPARPGRVGAEHMFG